MREGNKAQTNPIVAATGTDTYVNFEIPFASKMAPAISGKIAIFKKISYKFSFTNHSESCIKIAPAPRLAKDDLKSR